MTNEPSKPPAAASSGEPDGLSTQDLATVAAQLRDLLVAIESGELTAGAGMAQRLEGALIALRALMPDRRTSDGVGDDD